MGIWMLEKIEIKNTIQIAIEAGKAVMEIYKKDFSVEFKDDNSPLTQADTKANEIICTSLQELYPNIPIMSEENKEVPYEVRKDWEYYWCIDPIDGTKEFIKKNGEFTINIALIKKNIPVLGVVYAPAIDTLYFAKKAQGAYKIDLKKGESIEKMMESATKLPLKGHNEKLVVVASKSHLSPETEAFIKALTQNENDREMISKGSSLKLCLVAEGVADIYPRLAPTMEWDTAAADAIVSEAGKNVYIFDEIIVPREYLDGLNARVQTMVYNKQKLLNPWFVVS